MSVYWASTRWSDRRSHQPKRRLWVIVNAIKTITIDVEVFPYSFAVKLLIHQHLVIFSFRSQIRCPSTSHSPRFQSERILIVINNWQKQRRLLGGQFFNHIRSAILVSFALVHWQQKQHEILIILQIAWPILFDWNVNSMIPSFSHC